MSSQFPDWADFLFQPMRYKVAFGGRGSGKSWAFARALLVQGAQQPLRILCSREVQKSIKESVKRLLDDQIQDMGLGGFYQSLETEIRGANGTLIAFAGLASHTVESVKSYEGFDRVWLEEAQTISKKSLDILTPTIRKPGSEIWITFNPELDTDEVWKRFIENTPPNCIAQQVNYNDNPWFPQVLEDERLHCKETAPEDYDTIWEGKCRAAVVGAIYSREVQQAILDERIRPIPYDPRLKVHTVWDLGWNDCMSIIIVQRGITELRVIGYLEDSQKTLDYYASELNRLPYNWGYDYLPHDGNTRDFKTGKSTAEILQSFGRKPRQTPNIGVEAGIKMARMVFPRVYFDKQKTTRLVECLKRYRRAIPASTGEPGAPIHDEFSHGCFVGTTLVKTRRGELQIKDVLIGDEVDTPSGWAVVTNAGPTKFANELIEVEASSGQKVVCTPDHWFITRSGVHAADTLRYNSHVFINGDWRCKAIGFISMVFGIGFRDLITSAAQKKVGQGFCTEPYGKRKTDLSLMGLSYTTKIMTGVTTQLKIWSASRFQSITSTTMKTCGKNSGAILSECDSLTLSQKVGTGLKKAAVAFQRSMQRIVQKASMSTTTSQGFTRAEIVGLSHLSMLSFSESMQDDLSMKENSSRQRQMPLQKPQSGTLHQKDLPGTQQMERHLGKIESGTSVFAKFVARSLSRLILRLPSSATRIVKLRRFVPEERTLVYDLTVKNHHCYFANDFVVSNCDAWRYLAVVADQLKNDADERRPRQQRPYRPVDSAMGMMG